VTRLYVPTADAWLAYRRCWGLSYPSQKQSYRTGGFLFELLGSWGKSETVLARSDGEQPRGGDGKSGVRFSRTVPSEARKTSRHRPRAARPTRCVSRQFRRCCRSRPSNAATACRVVSARDPVASATTTLLLSVALLTCWFVARPGARLN